MNMIAGVYLRDGRVRWATVAVWAVAACLGRPQAVAADPQAVGQRVFMHVMPWYETPAVRGGWGGHWKGFGGQHDPDRSGGTGLPDIWSHYHPLIGPYDSADPDLIECHLAQLKLAGLDGMIVDWYGAAEALDYPGIHTASMALFDASARYGLEFAACYEDRIVGAMQEQGLLGPDGADGRLTADLKWLDTNWFPAAHYARLNGRPLLLNFGPIVVAEAEPWRRAFAGLEHPPAFYALHHLWRKAGAHGGFTWIHWNPWEGDPDVATINARLAEVYRLPSADPTEVIVSAFPGYHDVYDESRPVLAHRDGATLEESLTAALATRSPIVQIATWNDYGEGTMIEPTHELGYRLLEIVQAKLAARRGPAFPFTAADLRLPARLYAARKAKTAPAAVLDAIAASLARGDTAAAASALDQLEP